MKTILIATDFSAAARNASHYAAYMALAIDADILLLHVYQIPVVYLEVPVVVTEADMRQDAEKEMLTIKDELNRKTGGRLRIASTVRVGVFFPELKTVCRQVKPYTVVMGSQGKTAAERMLFGGHTVYAMQHLMWPLITVPVGAVFSSVKKIGLACDLDKVVETTPIDEIKKLVNVFHAELHVLNTGRKEVFDPKIIFESGLLEELLMPLKPKYQFITSRNTDEAIMEFSENNHIDLLVVLPKRHGLLDKLIYKSHTRQLVLNSNVPVMALHR